MNKQIFIYGNEIHCLFKILNIYFFFPPLDFPSFSFLGFSFSFSLFCFFSFFSAFYFFSPLSFFPCFFPFSSSSSSSYLSASGFFLDSKFFLRRLIVVLAVVAAVVTNSHAPPAIALLHPLHFQIPAASLLIYFLPQNGHIDFTL